MYTTQVKTAALPVARWLDAYCRPERFRDACQACPDYGKVWSCPPGVPDARTAFAPTEVSISSVTALFGAPIVIYMMAFQRGKSNL